MQVCALYVVFVCNRPMSAVRSPLLLRLVVKDGWPQLAGLNGSHFLSLEHFEEKTKTRVIIYIISMKI